MRCRMIFIIVCSPPQEQSANFMKFLHFYEFGPCLTMIETQTTMPRSSLNRHQCTNAQCKRSNFWKLYKDQYTLYSTVPQNSIELSIIKRTQLDLKKYTLELFVLDSFISNGIFPWEFSSTCQFTEAGNVSASATLEQLAAILCSWQFLRHAPCMGFTRYGKSNSTKLAGMKGFWKKTLCKMMWVWSFHICRTFRYSFM